MLAVASFVVPSRLVMGRRARQMRRAGRMLLFLLVMERERRFWVEGRVNQP